ncbi:MAG: hypothetical protein J1G38_03790 [Clostridiales bacterium]|nr:hypothetical protein [Clostridiales bacterium]
MNYRISPDILARLVAGSEGSIFRLHVERAVGILFKSTRYLTSQRLVDCIVLNLLLNTDITPGSEREILTFIQSKSRSFYPSVEREFSFIKDKFMEYAKTVVENIDDIVALDMRVANFIVYIMSKDISQTTKLIPDEVYLRAFDYSELLEIGIPHY